MDIVVTIEHHESAAARCLILNGSQNTLLIRANMNSLV